MTMIGKIVSAALLLTCSLSGMAQSIDEKIGNAMNTSDWIALYSIYHSVPADSINPFLEIFSRCLIGNRFNRPDVSIPAFQELLNTQSLDISNLVSSTHMFGMDLSRVGLNAEAASMINSILDQTGQYMDSVTISSLRASANRYSALAEYHPYQIKYPDTDLATIPFSIVPIGPIDKQSVLMHLDDSFINGLHADITFDTGAGSNIISHEMADKYNLTALEGSKQTVVGIGERDGYIAIAKEIRLGDIIVKDVPFIVVSLSSENEEADQYIDSFSIVIGSELMLQLKDVTLDFVNRQITVSTQSPVKSDTTPNMCFSNGMNLLANGVIGGTPMYMNLDSGDASYGTLGYDYYINNKEYIEDFGRLDTVRSAGIAGTSIMPCYYVPNVTVRIGDSVVVPADLVVKTQADNGYPANIGLRTMMLFGKIHFNMVDFVVTTAPQKSLISIDISRTKVPDFNFRPDNGMNLFQTIGYIGMGIARTMAGSIAQNNPDL